MAKHRRFYLCDSKRDICKQMGIDMRQLNILLK